MKKASYNKHGLQKGQRCKVIIDSREDVKFGEIITFKKYHWIDGFYFENDNGETIRFTNDEEFISLMNENQIRDLVDIALVTMDKKWFEELTYKLEFESEKG